MDSKVSILYNPKWYKAFFHHQYCLKRSQQFINPLQIFSYIEMLVIIDSNILLIQNAIQFDLVNLIYVLMPDIYLHVYHITFKFIFFHFEFIFSLILQLQPSVIFFILTTFIFFIILDLVIWATFSIFLVNLFNYY